MTLSIAIWRRYVPPNSLRVAAVFTAIMALPVLAIYYAKDPEAGPRLSGFSGQGGLGGGNSFAPPGFNIDLSPNDPVLHFVQTRVGHILYSPYIGDYCRRVLFHNQTGALYETGNVQCVNTAPEIAAATSQDRLNSLRKTFQK